MIKKILTKIYTFIFFLLFALQSFGNDTTKTIISYNHINVENGLASRQVLCGLQDSKGFIWLGTTHGLQRYDGKNFVTYTKEKNGLHDNVISKIVEDEQQQLWIMYGISVGYAIPSSYKIDILDLKTNTIQSFATKFKNKLPFAEERVGLIYSNEKKEFMFLVKDDPKIKTTYFPEYSFSIYFYNKEKGFFKTNKKTSIIYANDNFYFKGNNLITLDNDKIKIYNIANDSTKEDINYYQKIFYTKENKTFFFFKNNSNKFVGLPINIKNKEENNEINLPSPLKETEKVIAQFNDATNTNPVFVNNKQEVFIYNDEGTIKILDNSIWGKDVNVKTFNFFITNKNNYWICTSNGIYQVKIKKKYFTPLLSSKSYKLAMPSNYQNRNIHILGNNNFIFNSWGGTYNLTKNKSEQWNYSRMAAISDKNEYSDGSYFDGTNYYRKTDFGIQKYNIKTKESKYVKLPKEIIWVAIKNNKKETILASVGKIFVLNALNETYPLLYENGAELPNNEIQQFYYTKDSVLWAVGSNGIFSINKNNTVSNYYSTNSTTKNKIPYNNINGIIEDKQGILWLATGGGGLIKWDRKNNTLTTLTDKDGLSTNVLYCILEDDKGYLWISSDNGLMRLNTSNNYVKTYTTKDGITNNEFNRCSFAKAPDGLFLFGGMDGVNAFYPNDLYKDTLTTDAALKIIGYQKFSGSKNLMKDETTNLLANNKIILQPEDNLFTLQFQLLDYEIGEHKYAYKIEGIDEDWNYINDNSIRISSLPYGDYILKIKGKNIDGQWNRNELSIPITVITPFYKKWYFIALLFLLLFLCIYSYLQYRTRVLVKTKKILEQTVTTRTNQLNKSLEEKEILLREIHHRVKNNLSVINSLLELQANNVVDAQAKQALQESQNRVQSIALIHQRLYQHENLAAIEVKEFIEDMYSHISAVFYNKNIMVKTNFMVQNILLDIDTAVPLGLIINELITNSFKYAFTPNKEGEIKIELFSNPNGNYLLTYQDNGPGLGDSFNAQKNTTLGFRLIKNLSKQLSGKAEYIEKENQGMITIQFIDTLNRNQE